MTAFVALGNWPDIVADGIRAVHEHAYFKWSDAARVVRGPRCVTCTEHITRSTYMNMRFPSLFFCSEKCRADFTEHVDRASPQMGPPS